MKKSSIKSLILVSLFVILAPLILVGMTFFGNVIAEKGSTKTTQTTEQTAKVPEENKTTTNDNLPKANQDKVSDSNSNTSNQNNTSQTTNTVSTTPVAGQDYVIKSGDTLFAIAASAYGEANAQAGVEKIREENNLTDNNVGLGERIQIPRLS